MPPKRTATKKGKSSVKDSGAPASDDRTGKAGAAGHDPASIGTTASESICETTRTRSKNANRSASVDTVMATATDSQVSLANSSETVVNPQDRESQGVPTRGNGNSGVIQNTG